jgi:glyoxylase-like metal-dependent hydrolase (beta-lactamase superfamily II)
MVQHAVGQGGLFSGEVTTQGKPRRWVYDCGSNQHDAPVREIKTVAAGGDLDLLFLSHLDSDHVGGVDQLLTQVKVREVGPLSPPARSMRRAPRRSARRCAAPLGSIPNNMAGSTSASTVT